MPGRLRSLFVSASPLVVVLLLAGCGSAGDRTPSLARVPMPPRSKVILDLHACNAGSDAYCALQLVIAGKGYRTSVSMISAEAAVLRRLHWRHENADTALEHAAYSPGDKLRLTYATPKSELASIELGWVTRAHAVQVTLAHTLFADRPALSMLVEIGPG